LLALGTGVCLVASLVAPGTRIALADAPAADAATTRPYIPMSEMLTHTEVEERFSGGLPDIRGGWIERHFYSQATQRDAGYMVYVPAGYGTSGRRYPTLYLLHGVGGPSGVGVEEWLGYALTEDLDRMIALGLIEPMIVVLPNGENSFWMNHFQDNGERWGDFVAQELVRDVDAHFDTQPQRERRAVGGLSMGGYGALQLALNYPTVFGIAGAHSPTLRTEEQAPAFFGDHDWFAAHDPLWLVQSTNTALRVATWIDIGYGDKWRPAAEQLASAMKAKQAPVEFRVLEGEHEGWYWLEYLPEYLRFYSDELTATARTPYGAPLAPSRNANVFGA
jgi:enterochelin esterase-like enzyme